MNKKYKDCCSPIFDPMFSKIQKIAKNKENPKKYVLDMLASFLAFSASSQKNLNFEGLLNVFDL